MSTLQHAISSWKTSFPNPDDVLLPIKTRHALVEIDRVLAGAVAKKPASIDLKRSYLELKAEFARVGNLDTLNRRVIRHIPWIIFEPWEEDPPLVEDHRFVKAYVKRIIDLAHGRLVTGFVIGLLFYYPSQLPHFSLLAKVADKLLATCERPRCRQLREDVDNYGLLAEDGPKLFWHFLSGQIGSLSERLARTNCFSGMLLKSAFLEMTLNEALRLARKSLGTDGFRLDFINSLFALALEREQGKVSLRFDTPSQRKQFAEALLLPFLDRPIDQNIQQVIAKDVLGLYGDPRFDRRRWQGVDEKAIRVVLDWLIKDTLEDFFRLLAYFARGNEEATRHWRYRRAFWGAYLKKGVIEAAWVALAPKLGKQAAQILSKEDATFATIERGPGVLANHSALIMEIGDLIITEWSHNGKCRAWSHHFVEIGVGPKMYQKSYNRPQLIDYPGMETAHHHSEKGSWQRKLKDYIYEHTGITVRYMDYMPGANSL